MRRAVRTSDDHCELHPYIHAYIHTYIDIIYIQMCLSVFQYGRVYADLHHVERGDERVRAV